MHSFAPEFGLILPPPNTPLISHFPKRKGPSTVLPITVPSSSSSVPPILSPETHGKEILFSGIPFALAANPRNPQLMPILHAPAESFATDTTRDGEADAGALLDAAERGGEGLWAGAHLAVLAAFQTKRDGGRIVWAGGVEMFGDAFSGTTNKGKASGSGSGNALVAQDVVAWAFQESAVLRIDGVSHRRVGETEARERYTTNDVVVRIVPHHPPTHFSPHTRAR
jgi:oligosaccharyltransferase complex subunit beta